MELNPSMCQLLCVTNNSKPVLTLYTIYSQTLQSVDSAQYLGITVDSKLSFTSHTDAVSNKANGT